MKKLFVAVSIALLTFSCSSDDDTVPSSGNLKLSTAKFHVDFINFDSAVKNGLGRTIRETRFIDDVIPEEGVFIFYTPKGGLKAVHPACPCGGILAFNNGQEYVYGYDSKTKDRCGSQFDPTTGLPISGPAKDKKLRLLEYKVTAQETEGVYLITND